MRAGLVCLSLLFVLSIGADAQANAQAADSCGPNLADELSQRLDIRRDQARAAAGELLALARSRLAARDFSRLAQLFPEMDDLLKAAPDTQNLSGPGAWDSVVAAFQKVGLTRGTLLKSVPVVVNQVRCRGGQNLSQLLRQALR